MSLQTAKRRLLLEMMSVENRMMCTKRRMSQLLCHALVVTDGKVWRSLQMFLYGSNEAKKGDQDKSATARRQGGRSKTQASEADVTKCKADLLVKQQLPDSLSMPSRP